MPTEEAKELPIRASVRAHRRRVEIMRGKLQERFPGAEITNQFAAASTSLVFSLSATVLALGMKEKLKELGISDDLMDGMVESAETQLAEAILLTTVTCPAGVNFTPL